MSILALTSNTLIGTAAAGQIEYNGQFFGTDSAAARAQLQRITRDTSVTCAGQTSIEFTALPAWVKKITLMLSGVSTSGTSNMLVQIGAGSFTITGYVSAALAAQSAAVSATGATSVAGFLATGNIGANTQLHTGTVTILNITGTTWIASTVVNTTDGGKGNTGGGTLALGGTLDRVRITTVNGTDTFDTSPSAGFINILYEG